MSFRMAIYRIFSYIFRAPMCGYVIHINYTEITIPGYIFMMAIFQHENSISIILANPRQAFYLGEEKPQISLNTFLIEN